MRDNIELISHVVHATHHLGNVVHFGPLHLVLGHLLGHEAQFFFIAVQRLEADVKVETWEEVCLEVAICGALLAVDRFTSVHAKTPNLECELMGALTTDVVIQLECLVQFLACLERRLSIFGDLKAKLGVMWAQLHSETTSERLQSRYRQNQRKH